MGGSAVGPTAPTQQDGRSDGWAEAMVGPVRCTVFTVLYQQTPKPCLALVWYTCKITCLEEHAGIIQRSTVFTCTLINNTIHLNTWTAADRSTFG